MAEPERQPAQQNKRTPLSLVQDSVVWSLELRFWVALCVGGLTQFSLQVLQNAAQCAPLWSSLLSSRSFWIAFWATLGLYNLDGTLDAHREPVPPFQAEAAPAQPTYPATTQGLRRRAIHLTLTLLSCLALLWNLARGPHQLLWLVVPGFVLCALYAVRLLVRGRPLMLKSVPRIKAPFVGFSVGTAAFGVPLVESLAGAPSAWSSCASGLSCLVGLGLQAALWLSLCAFCTANALLFDMPDVQRDEASGVPTAPVVLGVQRAQKQCLAWVALGLASAVMTPLTARSGLLILGAFLFLATLLVKPQTPKNRVAFWVDGALLLPLFLRCIVLSGP